MTNPDDNLDHDVNKICHSILNLLVIIKARTRAVETNHLDAMNNLGGLAKRCGEVEETIKDLLACRENKDKSG